MSSQREQRIQRFHAAHPGATSRALARGDSYTRLANLVPAGSRVLDLACGDGLLTRLLTARGCTVTGVDLSAAELARARQQDPTGTYVRARAQALPFADGSFDVCVCHLALMLFDDPDAVIVEVRRVAGALLAVLGGGPTADGDDAFHRFLALAQPTAGHAGWRTPPDAERWELDLSGSFEEVWDFLGSSYELANPDGVRDRLRAEYPGRVPLRVVMFLLRR